MFAIFVFGISIIVLIIFRISTLLALKKYVQIFCLFVELFSLISQVVRKIQRQNFTFCDENCFLFCQVGVENLCLFFQIVGKIQYQDFVFGVEVRAGAAELLLVILNVLHLQNGLDLK